MLRASGIYYVPKGKTKVWQTKLVVEQLKAQHSLFSLNHKHVCGALLILMYCCSGDNRKVRVAFSNLCVCETTSHTLAGRKVLVSCRQDNKTSKHCVMVTFHEGISGTMNMRKKENPLKLHLTHCHF